MVPGTIVSDSKHTTRFANDGHPETPVAARPASRLPVDADRNGVQSHPRVFLDHNLEEEGYDGSIIPVAPSSHGQQQYQVTGPDHSHVDPGVLSRTEQPSLRRRTRTTSPKAGSSGKRLDNLR